MGQLDLGVTDARRNMVKKMLAPRMRNRLKDEEEDVDKLRKRDGSNVLLAPNLDKLVKEEGKSTSGHTRVRKFDMIKCL